MGGAGGLNDRMKGDFYELFNKNTRSLMSSLFGETGENANNVDGYILQVQIGQVYSKMAWMAFNDAEFEIEIEFKLIKKVGAEQKTISVVTKNKVTSKMGTSYSFYDNAHTRATEAINQAFVKAQKELDLKLKE